jgi:glycosyltransferase involved in cell wall biosynthesis
MASKTICLVTPIYPPDIGGPATYTQALAKNLDTVKKVITFSQADSVVSIPKKLPLFRQLLLFLTVLTTKTGIVYSQDPLVTGLMSHLAARLSGKQSLTKYVGDIAWERYQDKGGQLSLEDYLKKHPTSLRYLLSKFSLNLANKIIVPSQYLKSILKTYYGLMGNKIIIIPNFVVKPKLKTQKQKNQIIFVGRHKPWKNLQTLINAFNLVQLKDWQLIIIGVPQPKRHRHPAIKFLGPLSHQKTFKLMTQSKILVLPSFYEGFPHVLLEAGLAGCAVIASDIPANQILIKHRQTGLVFSPTKVEQLVSLLKQLTQKPKLRQKLARNLAQKVKPYTLANHLKLLKQVL